MCKQTLYMIINTYAFGDRKMNKDMICHKNRMHIVKIVFLLYGLNIRRRDKRTAQMRRFF